MECMQHIDLSKLGLHKFMHDDSIAECSGHSSSQASCS